MSRSCGVLVATVITVGLLVGGCSAAAQPYLPQSEEVSVEELWMRPSVDDAAAELDRMLAEVRGRWESELGLAGWSALTEPGRSGCAGNPEVSFERRTLPNWGRPGPVPDADWPRAVEIAAEVGGGYGFGAPQVVVARPGQFDASMSSRTGASVTFGSIENTAIGARTGCHPTAEALAERAGSPS